MGWQRIGDDGVAQAAESSESLRPWDYKKLFSVFSPQIMLLLLFFSYPNMSWGHYISYLVFFPFFDLIKFFI